MANSVRSLREAPVRRTLLPIVVLAGAGAGIWGLVKWKSQPTEVQFARVIRTTIHSSVPTNGRVEPIEWAAARAERAGPVVQISVARGQRVERGAPLVYLDSTAARANLNAAQARIGAAKAQIEVIAKGGRATDRAEISSGLDRARLDLANAQKEYDALDRLLAKQAATQAEVNAAKQKLDQAKLQIQSLEQRRKALAASGDRAAAQAQLDDAQAAVRLANLEIERSVIRAPVAGTVYQFDLKPGAYLNTGDAVAYIGRLDRVRVNVFVDEPDLGRAKKGMPVSIAWLALPGRHWQGEVDRTPTEIVAMGTRQVGEVVCVIENPGHDLLPGSNVDVEILTAEIPDALAIPKESVHTERGQTGVYLLDGDHIEWKPVTLGVANTTRTQVAGLNLDDAVALYSDKPLHNGMPVKPVFPQ
ncbi:MAG: efflux RND transporter periplasmic adaptor subunit [Bryobacteraceae bacterium]